MCGRYNLRLTPAELQQVFDLFREPDWQPRSNISPSQRVLAIRFDEEATPREPVLLKWGFLAPWAKDEKARPQPINARAESITGRMWGTALKRHRCLIPATSFYEWQARPGGGKKQPFDIALEGEEPFAFAGLWSRWERGTSPLETCTIITTSANEAVESIHDRMPVILHKEDYDRWLEPEAKTDPLTKLLRPYEGPMQIKPVDTLVPESEKT
jgi:putative SOS response-associated peptidase YedK